MKSKQVHSFINYFCQSEIQENKAHSDLNASDLRVHFFFYPRYRKRPPLPR